MFPMCICLTLLSEGVMWTLCCCQGVPQAGRMWQLFYSLACDVTGIISDSYI